MSGCAVGSMCVCVCVGEGQGWWRGEEVCVCVCVRVRVCVILSYLSTPHNHHQVAQLTLLPATRLIRSNLSTTEPYCRALPSLYTTSR